MQSHERRQINRRFESEGIHALTQTTERPISLPDIKSVETFWRGVVGIEGEVDLEDSDVSQWRESFSTVRANAQDSESYTVTLGEWNRIMRRIKAWKAPGPDGVRNIWWKILPAASNALRSETERLLAGRAEIPAKLTIGRTIIIFKEGDTRDPANYRPIACLNTAYKCMTTVASDYLLNHLLQTGALPDAPRALCTRRYGTWDCLAMDSLVTMDAKLASKDITVAWYDYKKAYDRVPHTVVDMTLRTVGAPKWL